MRAFVAIFATVALASFPTVGASDAGADRGGRLSPTGPLAVARAAHSATALPDGRVLIAGGCTLDGCEMAEQGATAELYDPITGSFGEAGSMTTERVNHSATPLPDGRVLIVGDWDRDGVLASAELYDPATDIFAATRNMGSRRAGFSATALPDGRVLIVGCYDGSQRLATAEVYDARTGAFTPTGPMTTPRSEHVAAVLPDGRVLVAGGSRDDDDVLASAEVYDPISGTFAPTGEMTMVRRKHAAIALPDGGVLVVGGSDSRDWRGRYASAEVYDPAAGTFTATDRMAAARFKLPDGVAPLPTDEILVAGGGDRAELYDPAAGLFRGIAGDLGASRAFVTATALPDGSVLIVGGYDPAIAPTAGAWLYRPDA